MVDFIRQAIDEQGPAAINEQSPAAINEPSPAAINEQSPTTVPWADLGTTGASEFVPGFFSKTFLGCFQMARVTIQSQGWVKLPSFHEWLKYIFKIKDRRFANDPVFPLVVTNMLQRRQALTLGNLYAERKLSELTMKQLKEKLKLVMYQY